MGARHLHEREGAVIRDTVDQIETRGAVQVEEDRLLLIATVIDGESVSEADQRTEFALWIVDDTEHLIFAGPRHRDPRTSDLFPTSEPEKRRPLDRGYDRL